MERFVKGDIVVLPFPFSDLSSSKKRPSLVLVDLPGDDIVLCQITSQSSADPNAISLFQSDFIAGNLFRDSYIRSGRIFTASKSIILYKVGSISSHKFAVVRNKIVSLLDQL